MSKTKSETIKLSKANYWGAVSKGYALIEEAKQEADFQKWMEANKDSLDFNYDQYQDMEYQSYQQPMSFKDWAFERWLMDECWNEEGE